MSHSDNAFDFAKILSSMQESSSRWIRELGATPLPASFGETWQEWVGLMSREPEKLAAIQKRFDDEHHRLLQIMSHPEKPDAELLSAQDKRFDSPEWQKAAPFRYLAESYLTSCRLLAESIESMEVDAALKQRMRFFAKQYADAMSPANFLMTNPAALKAAVESKGATLREGLANLREDVEKGHLSITDESAFEVGKNIAMSPGSVVFENEIFQLLQYAPGTPQVHLRPLLMVPPCINKFYILDLRPDNSFVEYAVQQGFTVFVMSWRNVSAEQGHLGWDEYLANGVIKAIDVVRLISNVDKINALGFCVGGTLLASALAVLRRLRHDVVESATFLTTFVDFSEVGEISAYIDAAFVERREREIGAGGVVSGAELAFAFSSLRANELVWNYVVNNYLRGRKPPAFDLLFWNGDSTNLPGPWYCYYLRNTYLENNLVKPDKLTMCGVPLDLKYVDIPSFVFAAREDHIVPWRTAFSSARHYRSKVDFVLGASGHIAGVVNPASKNKRSYWSGGEFDATPGGAERWLATATETEGSWWPRWAGWLKAHSGKSIPARTRPGSDAFPPIEPAPGRYVTAKA